METGIGYSSECDVEACNTAEAMGSGDLPVFATPAMAALMENAAMRCVAQSLPDGSTTVGSYISTSHVKPSPLGEHITATAVLTAIDGRRLTFSVKASDSKGAIGEGEHVRYVVDRERFMSKL